MLAAAVLCFAQCGGITIDPGLAAHELAAHQGGKLAKAELRPLRALDNVRPQFMADLALQLRRRIPERELRRARAAARRLKSTLVTPERLEQPLRDFGLNYAATLRVASLALSTESGLGKASALLEWVHFEHQWNPVALWFGLRYFSPRLPATDWLKGLRSADRSQAISRAKNMAWDLTVISTWLHRKKSEQQDDACWLLCSFDDAVLEIARAVLPPPSASDIDPAALMFEQLYGVKDGRQLFARYNDLTSMRQDPHRAYNRLRGQFGPAFTHTLEQTLVHLG